MLKKKETYPEFKETLELLNNSHQLYRTICLLTEKGKTITITSELINAHSPQIIVEKQDPYIYIEKMNKLLKDKLQEEVAQDLTNFARSNNILKEDKTISQSNISKFIRYRLPNKGKIIMDIIDKLESQSNKV